MLHKKVQQAHFIVFDFRKSRDYLISDEVRAARFGGESKLLLEPRHCAGSGVAVR